MKSKSYPTRSATVSAPAPRKRFHLEKLEQRVAPKGHWNPHSKWVGDGNNPFTSGTY
jgi:hypothetical protein